MQTVFPVWTNIKNENKCFPVFVTQRVTDIKEHSSRNEWHYITSKFNVADASPRAFHNNCRYINGLKFLRCPELPIFSCREDSFPLNLNNINFGAKYVREDEISQKRAPI